MRLFRSFLLARLLVGSVLLGFLSGAAGTVSEAAPEHPRQTWQRALSDGTLDRAVEHAQNADDTAASAVQVAAFLDVLAEAPGGEQLVAYLSSVADPADVLRALLGTSHLGSAVPFALSDTWVAPAPPPSSTLGARVALGSAAQPTPGRADAFVGMVPTSDETGLPVPRERYPAVQPLGP
ncbi:MAG: hypothetical protein AAF624_10630 [Bacteroidota bacterium]